MSASSTLFMGVLVLALLVWFHIPNRATASPGSDTKPKLIFFLTDDLDVDYPDQTWIDHYPRLKALLADRGTTFRNSFVSLPLCCPSRTSILRGQYAHNTTIFGLAPPVGGFADVHARGLEQSTIATWLQTAGYRTILLGKYQNGYGTTEVGPTYVPPGRDEWYAGVSNAACDQFNYALNESGHVVHYGDSAEDDLQDVLRDKALAFLAQHTGDEHRRPFVMNFSAYSPRLLAPVAPRHADIFPNILAPRPPSFNEAATSDKTLWLRGYPLLDPGGINQIDRISRKRLRSMRAVVDTVEALIKALFKSGELANTYFVFTSDNGFHLGQHRLTPGKDRPFEEDMRVPLIIRGPGIPAGMVRDEMTLNVDFAPTMAEWAGATMPAFVDGRSLIPLLAAGQDEPPAWRDGVLWEEGRPPAGLTAPPGSHDDRGDPRVRGRPQPSPYRELRTSRDIYLEYLRTGIQELDDLSRAPYQLDNVAPAAPAALLRKLSERLGRYMTCAGDSCREVEMS